MGSKKRYNPRKVMETMSKSHLRGKGVAYITGDSVCSLVSIHSNKRIPVNDSLFNAVTNIQHSWSVFLAVFGRDQLGADYMKAEEIAFNTPTYQKDLVEYLNDKHQSMMAGFNNKHLLGAGWIACPYDYNWDEEKAFELFSKLGAYQCVKDPVSGDVTLLRDSL